MHQWRDEFQTQNRNKMHGPRSAQTHDPEEARSMTTETKSREDESTFGYLARRNLHRDPRPPTKLLSQRSAASSLGHTASRRLPHLLREKLLDIGKTDKVFASEWITEEEVAVGTKCNKVCGRPLVRRCYVNIPITCHSLAMLLTIIKEGVVLYTYSWPYSIRGGAAITAIRNHSFFIS